MPIDEDALVLGLTGAFGSGCTTLATALEADLGFVNVKISDLITEEWRNEVVDAGGSGGLEVPPRGGLQDLGDERRKEQHLGYWVERAIDKIDRQPDSVRRVVLDGIRNPGEPEWLRSRFKNFFFGCCGRASQYALGTLTEARSMEESFTRRIRRD